MWGRWATRASSRLHRPGDPRALAVSYLYESILARQGLTFDALLVCRRRLETLRDSADPTQIVLGMRSLALALHHDGQCADAILHIAEAAADAADLGWRVELPVLCAQAQIYAGCGHAETAIRVLHRNRRLIGMLGRRHATQTAHNLARGEAEHPGHRCEYQPTHPAGAPRPGFWHTQVHAALYPPPPAPGDRLDDAPHQPSDAFGAAAGAARHAWAAGRLRRTTRGHHDL